MRWYLLVLCAYIVGSVPTAYIVARCVRGVDIMRHGSGNSGATNAARLLGTRWFFVVMALDAAKAFVLLRFTLLLGASTSGLFFLAAMLLLGNAYSCFLGFRGGKGIATTLGIVCALYPSWVAVLFIATWALTLMLLRVPFIASLISLVLSGACYFLCGVGEMHAYAMLAFMLWAIFRHLENITMFLASLK